MDSKNPTLNNLEGRALRRDSSRNSLLHGGDEEDDDFAAGMVADGFRPAASGGSGTVAQSWSIGQAITHECGTSGPYLRPVVDRPASIVKPPTGFDTSASPDHGGAGRAHERDIQRCSSDTSTFIGTEAPYQGPSGPSHPYEMYPQNVRLAPTLSVTTSSTEPLLESPYTGPRAPTHGYVMSPQAMPGEASALSMPVMTVGFTGLPDQYQRRLGPEGEDVADVIGPDGHSEPLPPYTRYPDELSAGKAQLSAAAAGTTVPQVGVRTSTRPSVAPVGIAGAGGMGLATRNPEFDGVEDTGRTMSSQSLTRVSSDASHHEINVAAVGSSEKGVPTKPWQLWMARRLWGVIPYWAVFGSIMMLLAMGIILTSVVASFFARHHRPPGPPDSSPFSMPTITADATLIPAPTGGLPPLATGTWGLPLGNTRSSSTCFNDSTQSPAWNCFWVLTSMHFTVHAPDGDNDGLGPYSVTLERNESLTVQNDVYAYGEQPMQIIEPVTLELVRDIFEPGRGPAWFKMLPFNKTVIVPETLLTAPATPTSNVRRDFNSRKGVAQQGEKPWICTWPDTIFELFIYPEQNSSWYRAPSTTTTTTTTTPSTSSSLPMETQPPNNSMGGPSNPPFRAAGSPPIHENNPDRPTSTPTPGTSSTGPFGPIDTGNTLGFLPGYPKVMKLEERRVPNSRPAVCTQVEIGNPGEPARTLKDGNGNPITFTIVEAESSYSEPPRSNKFKRSDWVRESYQHVPLFPRDASAEMSDCGCLWYVT